MEQTFNVGMAAAAQKKYQESKEYPDFAPRNGTCYRCKQNIYNEMETSMGGRIYKTGISVEKAGSELITGCPHCNHSYCD